MFYVLLYFCISLFSSTIGALSGIGGGIIIKPVMDSLGTLDVTTISFLSGCTVLTMSTVSLLRNKNTGTKIHINVSLFLALGACAGGILGKAIFESLKVNLGSENFVGMTQAILLLIINILVYIYIKFQATISTKNLTSKIVCIIIGIILGALSSFLGIGGGPINIAILYFFFSMKPKETTINSLLIIFFSQSASLLSSITSNSIPSFSPTILIAMCIGGVGGAIIGGNILRKINENQGKKIFSMVLILVILLNCYNIYNYAFL